MKTTYEVWGKGENKWVLLYESYHNPIKEDFQEDFTEMKCNLIKIIKVEKTNIKTVTRK